MNKVIHLKPQMFVKELAEQLQISPFGLIHDLAGMNVFVRSDQTIEPEVAASICKKYGYTLVIL
jgi:hypothetical protein